MIESCIATNEHPMRIDLYLVNNTGLSRHATQKMISKGSVTHNGNIAKNRTLVNKGDTISFIPPKIKQPLTPTPMQLDILFEDEDIIIVNKPPALVVHPGAGHTKTTLVEALLAHTPLAPGSCELRPGIVHRLDKDTSGVLIAAKNQSSYKQLVKLFSERKIKKTYIAIVEGSPGLQTINQPLLRHPKKRTCMAINPHGKEAITNITHVCSNGRYSSVTLQPLTGRTHQLRVHLTSIHCPIVGDVSYAPKRLHTLAPRQLLHALSLSFEHPRTKKEISVSAPLPEDFIQWTQKMGITCI